MKKLYYFIPFILVPSALLLCEFLDNKGFIKMNPYLIGIILVLISAIMGNFTPTNKRFDYLISVIMPLSLFVLMFVVGFLDETETYSRFDLGIAIKVSTQPSVLLMYLGMAFTAFILSFKSFRIMKRKTE